MGKGVYIYAKYVCMIQKVYVFACLMFCQPVDHTGDGEKVYICKKCVID